LLASLGQFSLGLNVLHQRTAKQIEEEKHHQKALRAKDIYNVLQAKVQAIREKNLPPEKWTVSVLNTMMQWYKRPEDGAIPSKKVDKLARYHEIKGHGDPPMPQPIKITIAPLPPLVRSELEPIIPEVPEEVDDAGNRMMMMLLKHYCCF
jgi:hypothetical protein